jgi:hypothetical protein
MRVKSVRQYRQSTDLRLVSDSDAPVTPLKTGASCTVGAAGAQGSRNPPTRRA